MAGLYIHIPFCATRCSYCDFFSSVNKENRDAYITALIKEMEMRKNYAGGEAIETVYLGGGTPSQLTVAELEKIFRAVAVLFTVKPEAEITMEANPDDMSGEYVSALRNTPVNRISMGVQSFHDGELQLLERRHSSKQIREVIDRCRGNGYDNLSIDLIYGLPSQTVSRWEKNLEAAIELDVPHISAYHLTYEEGTALWKAMNKGSIKAVDEETSIKMFELLIDRLAVAGFEQYEISNFARFGMLSKHNSSYWQGKKYLGIGASAHSYDTESREWNVSSLSGYIKGIMNNQPLTGKETPDGYNDYIMTGLRTRWGINPAFISAKFGDEAAKYCMKRAKRFIDSGMLDIKDGSLRLTRSGMFVSDSLICDLLKVDSYTKQGV